MIDGPSKRCCSLPTRAVVCPDGQAANLLRFISRGRLFQRLHVALAHGELLPFPPRKQMDTALAKVLAYDRPDIVLTDDGTPILVLERTEEVPSGHNVGQRFARLAAAAQMQVPCVYFGPYAAYKHGGSTQGPRYMNLRLFGAIQRMAAIESAAITTVNWPVDANYELIKSTSKDSRMRQYLDLFFDSYKPNHLAGLNQLLQSSVFEREQEIERLKFIENEVKKPEQYSVPPPSVTLQASSAFAKKHNLASDHFALPNLLLYNVGMDYIRSDPYTGSAILYAYLYCGGMRDRTSHLVLHFPRITRDEWANAARSTTRKDVRLYLAVADGIVLGNRYIETEALRHKHPVPDQSLARACR